MNTRLTQKLGSLALGIAFAAAIVPGAALAQDRPSYASPGEDTVQGRIVSIDGEYHISVRDQNGYVDHVALHQGTIINPTGLTLQPGMSVTILGVNAGNDLAANEIDTPYTYAPAYGYGYPGYAAYPPVSVGLGFGFGGWGGRWR